MFVKTNFLIILIMIIFSLSFSSYAQSITTLTIREKESVTTQNYPLIFGHVFKKGEVTNSVAVKVGSQLLSTQFDIKRKYDDNSVRHGIISVILPEISANQDLQIELIKSTANANTDAMTKAEILGGGIESEIRLTDLSGSGYSGSLTAYLNQTITDCADIDYWLSGSVVTEILLNQKLNNSLNASWEVRHYPGWDGIRISNSIENVQSDFRGNVNYAVDIQMGDITHPLSSLYSKPTFQHNYNARWRKVLWIGNEPPQVEIRYDVHYLINSGHIMNYAVDEFQVPEETIAGSYSRWESTDHDIMETGYIQTYFPTTGGREEIGVLPTWTTRYLFSMDNRMREIMLNHAEMFSGCPIHYRESDTSRSFYGHIVSIDDRPTVWIDREDFQWQDDNDRLPEPIGSEETVWYIDRAHQASFAYIPYLITGEKYYLDELYYWAGYDLGASNFSYREENKGLIKDQVRGEAWAIRNIAEAAALAPDDDIEKVYLEEKVQNNIDEWLNEQIQNEQGSRYPFNAWGINTSGRNNGVFENEQDETNIYGNTSGWMEDWVILILTHMKELGYNTKPIIDIYHSFVINRFSHPDFNWYNGGAYHFPLQFTVDKIPRIQVERDAGPYLETWKEANESYTEQPNDFITNDYPFSYNYKALAALSCVTEYTVEQNLDNGSSNNANGLDTYTWLKDNLYNRDKLNDNPTWALVPRIMTSIKSNKNGITDGYTLKQNYPNPFNPKTIVNYELRITSYVELSVYDILGQKVATLVNGHKTAGKHKVTFNGANLPSGLYFYKIETKEFSKTGKMILMK